MKKKKENKKVTHLDNNGIPIPQHVIDQIDLTNDYNVEVRETSITIEGAEDWTVADIERMAEENDLSIESMISLQKGILDAKEGRLRTWNHDDTWEGVDDD